MAWLERFWFGCGHCHGPESCPLADVDDAGAGGAGGTQPRGAGLVLPAVAVFILPLITAIGGAHLAGRWCPDGSFNRLGRWQTAGAVIGLLIGVALAKLLLSWRRRPGATTKSAS